MLSEEDLLHRIKEGDAHAFESLYELYKGPVANLLHRLCFDKQAVDDLMQEVFIRVWRGSQTFRGASKVSTWIFRIVYNVWAGESRKPRDKPAAVETAGGVDPADAALAGERARQVQEAIKSLSENDRVILLMSEYNGFSYQEISDILGIPLGTVKSRFFYALKHLRERLKK